MKVNNQHSPVVSGISLDRIQANSIKNDPMRAASTIGKGEGKSSTPSALGNFIKGLLGGLGKFFGLSKSSAYQKLNSGGQGQGLQSLHDSAANIAQNNLSEAIARGLGAGKSKIVPGSKGDIIPGREGLAAEQAASKLQPGSDNISTASAEPPNQERTGRTQGQYVYRDAGHTEQVGRSKREPPPPSTRPAEAAPSQKAQYKNAAHAAEATPYAWNLRSVQEYHKNELATYKESCLEFFDQNVANPSPETRAERRKLEAELDRTIETTLKNIRAQFRMGGGGALDVMKDTLTSAKEDMETKVAVSLNKAGQEEVVTGVRTDPREPPVKTVSMFAEDKIKEAKQYERECMEWFDKKVAFYGAHYHLNAPQAEQANAKVTEMRQNLTKAFAALEKKATSYVNSALRDLPSNTPISQKAVHDADVLLGRFFYEPADQMLKQLEMHLRVMDEQFRARYNNMS